MTPAQPRLIPDPQPLVEKLGRDFFRALPRCPGVYFLRGPADAVLYIGKAKCLRQRLGSYRVANPERMPKRILRLVHRVESILWEECADEAAALAREAELLLELRPKFNRAGVWRPPLRSVAWRAVPGGIELGVLGDAADGWNELVVRRSGCRRLVQALARVAWCRMQPERGFAGMPYGWWTGRRDDFLMVPGDAEVFRRLLEELGTEDVSEEVPTGFPAVALAQDVEFLRERMA